LNKLNFWFSRYKGF